MSDENIIVLPASQQQLMAYVDSFLFKNFSVYNLGFRLSSPGNFSSLEKAQEEGQRWFRCFQTLIIRHEALRTICLFNSEKQVLTQNIMPTSWGASIEPRLKSFVYSDSADLSGQLAAIELAITEEKLIYNDESAKASTCPPHWRFYICLGESSSGVFHVSIFLVSHHILADGLSVGILCKELATLKKGEILNNPAVQYRTFCERPVVPDASVKRFWLNELRSLPDSSMNFPLPFDFPPANKIRSGRCEIMKKSISSEDWKILETLADSLVCTKFNLLTALFGSFLSLMTGEKDFCLGLPVSNRKGLESTVGFLSNILPIRFNFTEYQSPPSLLQVSESVRDKFSLRRRKDELSFRSLVDFFPKLNLNKRPFFNVTISLLDVTDSLFDHAFECGAPDDLTLIIREISQEKLKENGRPTDAPVEFQFYYFPSLFKESTIDRISSEFFQFLSSAIAKPNVPLVDHMPRAGSGGFDFGPSVHSIPDRFFLQAKQNPSHIACRLDDSSLTYHQLAEEVLRVTSFLRSNKKVRPGMRIGQCVNRSIAMLTGILSIMAAGCIYVPLNPSDPSDRLNWLMKNSEIEICLVGPETEEKLKASGAQLVNIEDLPKNNTIINYPQTTILPSSVAYEIYTSGSTGNPKGVLLTHDNFLYTLNCYCRKPEDSSIALLADNDCVLSVGSCTFDVHVMELVGSVAAGACVQILQKNKFSDFGYLCETIQKASVTILPCVPSIAAAIAQLAQWDKLGSLRWFQSFGEPLSPILTETILRHLPAIRIANAYGPAETNVVTEYRLQAADAGTLQSAVPIGKPFPGTFAAVLDGANKFHPSEPGQLLIGGPGVFAGYMNRPDLVNQSFFLGNAPSSFPYYKTGDLVRLDESKDFWFLGRSDFQVKLNGQRLEIGEVESAVNRLAASGNLKISNCIVTKATNESGTDYLIAYCECADRAEASAAELVKFRSDLHHSLGSILQAYMVPRCFVLLGAFPLNQNGKVDRKILTAVKPVESDFVNGAVSQSVEISSPPRTAIEEILSVLFLKALKKPESGMANYNIHSDFFRSGGNSLSAMTLFALIKQAMEGIVKEEKPGLFTPADRCRVQEFLTSRCEAIFIIFDNPTVAKMAEFIMKAGQQEEEKPKEIPKAEAAATPASTHQQPAVPSVIISSSNELLRYRKATPIDGSIVRLNCIDLRVIYPTPNIVVFETNGHAFSVEILRMAAELTLFNFPIFSGRLFIPSEDPQDWIHLAVNNEGILFTVAKSSANIDELYPIHDESTIVKDLGPFIAPLNAAEPLNNPVASLQVTILSDGNLVLGFTDSHTITDDRHNRFLSFLGRTYSTLFNAPEPVKLFEEMLGQPISYDYLLHRDLIPRLSGRVSLAELNDSALHKRYFPSPDVLDYLPCGRPFSRELFKGRVPIDTELLLHKVSKGGLEAFTRALINFDERQENCLNGRLTAFESVVAFFWPILIEEKLKALSWSLEDPGLAAIGFPSDFARLLEPAVPEDFLGNTIIYMRCVMPVKEILDFSTGSPKVSMASRVRIVKALRETMRQLTRSYVKTALLVLNQQATIRSYLPCSLPADREFNITMVDKSQQSELSALGKIRLASLYIRQRSEVLSALAMPNDFYQLTMLIDKRIQQRLTQRITEEIRWFLDSNRPNESRS